MRIGLRGRRSLLAGDSRRARACVLVTGGAPRLGHETPFARVPVRRDALDGPDHIQALDRLDLDVLKDDYYVKVDTTKLEVETERIVHGSTRVGLSQVAPQDHFLSDVSHRIIGPELTAALLPVDVIVDEEERTKGRPRRVRADSCPRQRAHRSTRRRGGRRRGRP